MGPRCCCVVGCSTSPHSHNSEIKEGSLIRSFAAFASAFFMKGLLRCVLANLFCVTVAADKQESKRSNGFEKRTDKCL